MAGGRGPWRWLRDHPWIWFVLLFLAVLAANLVFVWIATRNPPIDAVP